MIRRSCLQFGALAVVLLLPTRVSHASDDSPPFVPPPIEVPEGFEVSIAAAPPLVNYPMMACFDDRGRLYVAESDGRNLTTKAEIEEELPRFVRRLVDTDGDGVFDESTVFADRMTMPEGGLWHDGALYIISAPYLWRLEDTDDDGVADRREKVVGYMEFDGRANQHGPYLGPNGRLYFTGGHFGYRFEGTDGSRTGSSRAAGVFSCLPDGSDVRIDGQGGINPVDIVFTAAGEMLSTCAIYDSFGGRRHDALIHWVPGGLTQRVYGEALLPETGFRLPATSRWGQVAPAGLVRYRGGHLGAGYRDDLFACHFNAARVVHIDLVPDGASFRTEERDFLTSSSRDFHPTDILEDADGSLLLLDTGGWLSWGCPFSKVAKPEVRGAVYRIRRTGGARADDPHGQEIDWAEARADDLAALLGDRRPAVRDRAKAELIERGDDAAPAVVARYRKSREPAVRRRCVWTLSQLEGEVAGAVLRTALADPDPGTRQAAVRSVGARRDRGAMAMLVELLDDGRAAIRRAAASALAEIGDPAAAPALFKQLDPGEELHLQHAVVHALITLGNADAALEAMKEKSHTLRQRAALRVLQHADPDSLDPSAVVEHLGSADPALSHEAREVIAARPDWRREVMQLFAELCSRDELDPGAGTLLEGIVHSFAADEAFHRELEQRIVKAGTPVAVQVALLGAVATLDAIPESLLPALRSGLESSHEAVRFQALSGVLRSEGGAVLDDRLAALARDADQPASLRVAAVEARVRHRGTLDASEFALLARVMRDDASPVLLGRQAARALGRLQLAPDRASQAGKLCELIAGAAPLQLAFLFEPFARLGASATEWPAERIAILDEGLATAIGNNPGRDSLHAEEARALAARLPDGMVAAGKVLLGLAGADADRAAGHEAKLAALLEVAATGNASRGRALFHSIRSTCSYCHRVGGRGGSLGPDLSTIGAIRGRRDLLEAIVFPSATVVNGFETYAVSTRDGDSHLGLVHRETRDAVYLIDAGLQVARIPRERIAGMVRSPVSTMPGGFDGTLNPREIADLVAFLETCR